MGRLAWIALVASLAGCASGEAPDDQAARSTRARRDRSRDGVIAPAPATSGVRPAGSAPAPRPAPRPAPAPASAPPPVAPEVEAQWPAPSDGVVDVGPERLERPRPAPPVSREHDPLDAPAGAPLRPDRDGARTGPWPAPPPEWLAPPLQTDAAADWLRAAEASEPDASDEAAGDVRDLLDALGRELGAVRDQLHDLTLARRASEARLAAKAAARDRREQEELLERHRPPHGVAVYPPDAWKTAYQRDLAELQAVQQRRHATEKAVIDAEEANAARPIHARKRDLEALRIRARVLLRRLDE